MILKLMGDQHDIQDDNPMKPCTVIANIYEAKFRYLETGEAALDVQYSSPNKGLDHETFVLRANAYLMNDSGKTVQVFSAMAKEK